MLITDEREYDLIWKKVYDSLGFKPSASYRGHSLEESLPFEIDGVYAVYAIDAMTDSQIDAMPDIIGNILIREAQGGRRMYALDWQHSAFLSEPGSEGWCESVWVEHDKAYGGGYHAYFPSFYPDGDYCFFIDEDFEYGYLGHPWRKEVWVFGASLVEELDRVSEELGWKRLR